jgi:hypothetical protein
VPIKQVQCAEQALGSCGLIAADPEEEAELPQLLQARASVRIQLMLIEVLREVCLLAPEPFDRQIKPSPKLLEGLGNPALRHEAWGGVLLTVT